ncbi:MAG TPA: helix-turn-helix transcriptional regulator [Microbacterium sp.]|uniref:response regulator transcription factor n=1 Tax=Microbacterium sp. TaxID=51671 RepID=UPI002B46E07E|nr:helix-turn-helix transcriptional regulator [Microbacterium sp.]HKT55958.1 helix-turn-helix transcriptional regulator [Microbacterium sp.]
MSVAKVSAPTIGAPPGITQDELATLVDRVAVRYGDALELACSPLATRTLTEQRRQHVADVVTDVVARFCAVSQRSGQAVTSTTPGAMANGVQPRDGIDAIPHLFTAALTETCATLPLDPVDVAPVLLERLMNDVSETFEAVAHRQNPELAVREYVDVEALRGLVSARQADIFQRLVDHAPAAQIADELGISPKTLKNHITAIGKRLDAQGRPALLQRARELSILITVPAVILANTISDTLNNANLM